LSKSLNGYKNIFHYIIVIKKLISKDKIPLITEKETRNIYF